METPSARIIADAQQVVSVRDGVGRDLVLRRPGPVDRLRMFKALGPELAQNTAYLGMAMLAVSITAIDGVPVPAPVNEAQLESLLLRLGDAGLAAVARTLAETPEIDLGN